MKFWHNRNDHQSNAYSAIVLMPLLFFRSLHLIFILFRIWCSPLHGIPVCHFLTSPTAVIWISLFPICTSGEDVILATDTLTRGSGMVGPINKAVFNVFLLTIKHLWVLHRRHYKNGLLLYYYYKPGLTHVRPVSGTMCALSIASGALLACILIHDYDQCINSSSCYKTSYYINLYDLTIPLFTLIGYNHQWY